MVNFPNAKINLGLHVVNKRDDGYHNIETIFYPVRLYDALEIQPASGAGGMTVYGLDIPGDPADNLCLKALHLIRRDYPRIPDVDIHLLKHIPFGAGLGGGSADAAFLLKLLNERFTLGLSIPQLKHYCDLLGSDCAFFIENKPLYATGRGNELSTLNFPFDGLKIVLIKPDVHVSTAMAYANVSPRQPDGDLRELIRLPLEEWEGKVKNDFELAVFKSMPALSRVKKELYDRGAVYASMSGSGSAFFGIFREYPNPFCWKNGNVFFC